MGKIPGSCGTKMNIILIKGIVRTTPAKYGKQCVTMEFPSGFREVFFISDKQHKRLKKCFEYSCKREGARVLGVFDADRFVWAGVRTPHYSEEPFLREHFGAIGDVLHEWPYANWTPPVLEPLENVEVNSELVDT